MSRGVVVIAGMILPIEDIWVEGGKFMVRASGVPDRGTRLTEAERFRIHGADGREAFDGTMRIQGRKDVVAGVRMTLTVDLTTTDSSVTAVA